MNYCYLTVTDVRDAELGRKIALCKFILDWPRVEEDFIEYIGTDINNMKSEELYDKSEEFAEQRGYKILSETPYVKFDEEKQQYYVNVGYKISMG